MFTFLPEGLHLGIYIDPFLNFWKSKHSLGHIFWDNNFCRGNNFWDKHFGGSTMFWDKHFQVVKQFWGDNFWGFNKNVGQQLVETKVFGGSKMSKMWGVKHFGANFLETKIGGGQIDLGNIKKNEFFILLD